MINPIYAISDGVAVSTGIGAGVLTYGSTNNMPAALGVGIGATLVTKVATGRLMRTVFVDNPAYKNVRIDTSSLKIE